MSFESKTQERLQKLIEDKTTEVQRANNAKLESAKTKLKILFETEKHLYLLANIMNRQLTSYNKTIKVKGNTEEMLKELDGLDPLDPEMKIPNKEIKIGIGYVHAKNPQSHAYAKAVVEFTLGNDKVSVVLNDTVLYNIELIKISNEMMEDLLFKMIKEAKW